ncbi:S-receptor-like serine/threonine-protein kinase protein [Dioscorea alata]|uniref:S-receptor-like serine/threonine-protein kinase protein n=1 Tax=Dioscorea alata TaxID=55571 RepID=A0ACB7VZU2_DIOAL|nr:S-receptor-like serine/threonine-protein kinase protein [Dioscorea alata]
MLLFMFFLILQTLDSESAAAPKANCQINLESTLPPSSSWLSPSGRFAFGFYPEGSNSFKVGIQLIESPNKTTVIWTSNRDDSPVSKNATLKFGEGGLKLLLATSQGEDQNIVDLGQTSSAYCASMLNSGNFVIYDSNSSVLWQTFDSPTDTLMVGQVLTSGAELISSVSEMNHSSGRFRLRMQEDGNLVTYRIATVDNAVNAYWASNTASEPYSNLNLSQDGILFLTNYNNESQPKNLTDGDKSYNPNTIHLARLESNGMLNVYACDLAKNTSAVLDKMPDNQCEVKGICGLNSYCTFSGGNQVCLCLPYFDYINDKDTHAGCQRNFISSACLGVGDNDTYHNTMDEVKNVQGFTEHLPATAKLTSKDDCRQSCLDDCNCDVAVYYGNDGSCFKQSLPLTYGLENTETGNPSIAFIKRTEHRNTVDEGLDTTPGTVIKKELSGRPLIAFITVVSGLIIFILVVFFIVFKCQAGRYRMIWRSKELALTDEIAPRSFSYYELYEATEGYKEEVGKGAFGTVFRGTLPSTGMLVAVKRLEKVVEGEREFQTEMKAIGRTHHRNLVRLLGFCNEGSNRLLVYEFMSNGSLANLVFKPDHQNRPSWKDRFRIALDVARGIHYLHEDCGTHIIHCDIKPQNILMDENWTAKISDFGLAKLLMPTQTRTFTGIRGTRGYLAPEWHKNTPITVKTDVYSFGIVLLEILCCRKNMELEAEADQIILSDWVCSCYLAGELEKLMLDEEVDMVEFARVVKVALWCIQTDPTQRPSMKNVIIMLEGCAEISSPPHP